MPRDLKADQEMLRTVLALAEKRDIVRAAAIAEQALASGFEHPLLLNVLATRLEHEGNLDEALQLLERAVRLAPEDIGVRNALSLCLQRLDRPAEALPSRGSAAQGPPESCLRARQSRQRAHCHGSARQGTAEPSARSGAGS